MNAFRRSVIIDIDGTLYDNFSHDDKKIISKIFRKNVLVRSLDKFLWIINSLDFISNSMGMLNLRLWIYSIISFKNYDLIKEEYRRRYQSLLLLNLQSNQNVFEKISGMYDIILVTNNIYAVNILFQNLKYEVIYAPNIIIRREQIWKKNDSHSINYVIGNNYTDDIFLAKRINALSIYVGKSIISKSFKADFNVLSFNDILQILKDGS